jgi:hypothetical protein
MIPLDQECRCYPKGAACQLLTCTSSAGLTEVGVARRQEFGWCAGFRIRSGQSRIQTLDHCWETRFELTPQLEISMPRKRRQARDYSACTPILSLGCRPNQQELQCYDRQDFRGLPVIQAFSSLPPFSRPQGEESTPDPSLEPTLQVPPCNAASWRGEMRALHKTKVQNSSDPRVLRKLTLNISQKGFTTEGWTG